jgi:hypothetical protein
MKWDAKANQSEFKKFMVQKKMMMKLIMKKNKAAHDDKSSA